MSNIANTSNADFGELGEIAEVNPRTDIFSLGQGGYVSFIGMADVSESGRITGDTAISISAVSSGLTSFKENDILFAKITPCMENGKGTIANQLINGFGFGSTEFHVLRAKPTGDYRFIFQHTISNELRIKAEQQMTGSAGQRRVPANFLKQYRIFLPIIDEQRKIAEILTTVDNLIEQTEAAISKYQAIKQGVIHDLFTRGVDANGHLRPPREEAPELYKKSELGWIPREWQFVTCGEICKEIVVGIVIQPAKYYTNQGIYVLRSANVRETGIDDSSWVFMSPKDNEILSKSKVYTGDLVTVRTGYPGTTCVIPEWLNGANCVDIIILRPDNTVRSNFLSIWINSYFGADQVLKMQGGLAQQHFNVGEMKNLTVALPNISEQDRIIQRIQTLENKISQEQILLNKTNKQKHGLMQDLLSGRVRVPTADTTATQEPPHAS